MTNIQIINNGPQYIFTLDENIKSYIRGSDGSKELLAFPGIDITEPYYLKVSNSGSSYAIVTKSGFIISRENIFNIDITSNTTYPSIEYAIPPEYAGYEIESFDFINDFNAFMVLKKPYVINGINLVAKRAFHVLISPTSIIPILVISFDANNDDKDTLIISKSSYVAEYEDSDYVYVQYCTCVTTKNNPANLASSRPYNYDINYNKNTGQFTQGSIYGYANIPYNDYNIATNKFIFRDIIRTKNMVAVHKIFPNGDNSLVIYTPENVNNSITYNTIRLTADNVYNMVGSGSNNIIYFVTYDQNQNLIIAKFTFDLQTESINVTGKTISTGTYSSSLKVELSCDTQGDKVLIGLIDSTRS